MGAADHESRHMAMGMTTEQRQAFQSRLDVHPLTCGGNRTDDAHRAYQKEHGGDFGQLVAVEGGWRCPVCGYFQALGVIDAIIETAASTFDK